MKSHYLKTRMIKMGQWATLLLDMETWYGQETNYYFKKLFGIPKGILIIYDATTGYTHNYIPKQYFTLLQKRIKHIKKNDYKALERKLKTFYPLSDKARRAVEKIYKDPKKLSNKQINDIFLGIRHWIHRLAIYDQFGWIAEEGFMPQMKNILVNKLGMKENSPEYQDALFTLTMPENTSTTIKEKMAVLEQILKIKTGKQTTERAGKLLAGRFGWLPVFCYGQPWQADHYIQELEEGLRNNVDKIKEEYLRYRNYQQSRKNKINQFLKEHPLDPKDLQIFVDFGLAIDTRNEAEYFVSFGSSFLMPLYKKISKRFFVSISQLRNFTESEISDALLGKVTVESILDRKGKYAGIGYDKKMINRIDFAPEEAEELFKFIESYVRPIQGGDENQGTCANPGKAIGKIKIVPTPNFNHKVNNGDILVTYATTTDYLPAMKRAAAIITEVGGLTCHAAVVSREFNIPCIVALKNAMSNFKDGDVVEVDANKGIVRKIK